VYQKTFCLHLWGRKVKKKKEAACFIFSLKSEEDGCSMFLQNGGYPLHYLR
jgi:hypothetical protein